MCTNIAAFIKMRNKVGTYTDALNQTIFINLICYSKKSCVRGLVGLRTQFFLLVQLENCFSAVTGEIVGTYCRI